MGVFWKRCGDCASFGERHKHTKHFSFSNQTGDLPAHHWHTLRGKCGLYISAFLKMCSSDFNK